MDQNRSRSVYVIPVGYVFRPEPEELLGFLRDSIMLRDQWVRPPEIRKLDLYGGNPWTVLGGPSEKPLIFYVMTRVKKKAPGKARIERKAGIGTWKIQNKRDVIVQCQNGAKLKGLKRNLVFEVEEKEDCFYSPELHGHWIMNEYSLLNEFGFEDYVICEIHTKAPPKSKRKLVVNGAQNKVVKKKATATDDDDAIPSTSGHHADSYRDRQGMMLIPSVDPFERHGHHYSNDHDRHLTNSCVPAKQSCPPAGVDFPDGFWDFLTDPTLPAHQGDDGLGLSLNDLDEDPSCVRLF